MTNEMLAAGVAYLLLFVGIATLRQDTLLQPGRWAGACLGLVAGLASLPIGLLGQVPFAASMAHAHPPLIAITAFLFGPISGATAALAALLGQWLLADPAWGTSLGQAACGLLLGLAWHALAWRRQVHGALAVAGLGITLVLALAAWLPDYRLPSTGWSDWLLYSLPWRHAFGVVVLAGGAELLRSRARSMQQLRLREGDLLRALKATGGGRWEWDLQLRRFAYQGEFFHAFGFADSPADDHTKPNHLPEDEFLARIDAQRHPEDRQRLAPYLAQTAKGEIGQFQAEFRLRDTQGRWHWLSARGHAVQRSASGRVLRLGGMLLDLTEQRTLHEALQSAEAKYTRIFQTLPDPAGITQLSNGQYLDVNPAFERLFEKNRSQIVGHTSLELGIWADPLERTRLLEALGRDAEVHSLPMTAYRGEHKIPGLMSACTTRIGGDDCLVFVFHDLAQEQRIRQELQSANNLLLQAGRMARLGAWEFIPGRGIAYWSDICYEIHGLAPGSALPTNYTQEFVLPEWREALQSLISHGVRQPSAWSLELQVRRTDGRQIWVRVRGEPVLEQGRVVRLRGVLQDIDDWRRTRQELSHSEERLVRMFQALPYPLGFTRLSDGSYLDVNPAWEQLTGFSRAEALGQNVVGLGIYTPEARIAAVQEALRCDGLTGYEIALRTRSGAMHTVLQSMSRIDIRGEACWLFAVHDITERKQAEQQIREREQLLSLTIAAAALGTWDWDLVSGMIRGDARWRELAGLQQADDATAIHWTQGLGNNDIDNAKLELARHESAPQTPFDTTHRTLRADMSECWLRHLGRVVAHDTQGKPTRMVGMTIDVTSQHTHARQLERMAHYDALTGLPNRVLLQSRLRQGMAQSQSQGLQLGVGYLDLDGFKPVNDRLGHAAGDRLLVMVAERLQQALRASDCVARLGGDEFIVLLPNLAHGADCTERLRTLMQRVATPYQIDGETVVVTVSIGYTLYPQDDADADTLLRHADQAMYTAKQAGRNCLHGFDAQQERAHQALREQGARLRQALACGELQLYLQPKVDMRQGAVVGAEALVRWLHPERGLLLPGQFLHQALGNAELQSTLGVWVVDQALAIIESLQQQGLPLPVSINITPEQLHRQGFADWLAERLAQHPAVAAHLLQLELTESAALLDIDHAARELAQLRALGMGIALDDFGTGYSSLAYLRRLPVDHVKLDRSFVAGMAHDAGDKAIVQGVIGLAHSFSYAVIAEGVETEAQGLMLLNMGCTLGQGHGIAQPMPAGQLPAWVRAWRAPASWLGQVHT